MQDLTSIPLWGRQTVSNRPSARQIRRKIQIMVAREYDRGKRNTMINTLGNEDSVNNISRKKPNMLILIQ